MGIFGPRLKECPASVWTTLIRTRFAQIPKQWTVTFRAGDGGEVSGEFSENKSSWIFPGTPRSGKLKAELTFRRGYWNTFYTVSIKPDRQVIAEIH